jgi:hypothetical protein
VPSKVYRRRVIGKQEPAGDANRIGAAPRLTDDIVPIVNRAGFSFGIMPLVNGRRARLGPSS